MNHILEFDIFESKKYGCSIEDDISGFKSWFLDWKGLYNFLKENKKIKEGDPLIIVWGPDQKLYYTNDGKSLIKSFKVSTGSKGFGNEKDIPKTPLGLLKTGRSVRAPKLHQVLVSKTPYYNPKDGKPFIVNPGEDSSRIDGEGKKHKAEVLTGLIELHGIEDCNSNAFSRSIYFHGTNREDRLGSKASGGCIRVSNKDIIWMIPNVKSGTKVYVKP